MAKVYLLKKMYSSEFEGNTELPLVVSTNLKQLKSLENKLNKSFTSSSEESYLIKEIFSYKASKANKVIFVMYNDSDFDWEFLSIEGCFFELEKTKKMIDKCIQEVKRKVKKENLDGIVSIYDFEIHNSLDTKKINELYKA